MDALLDKLAQVGPTTCDLAAKVLLLPVKKYVQRVTRENCTTVPATTRGNQVRRNRLLRSGKYVDQVAGPAIVVPGYATFAAGYAFVAGSFQQMLLI